MKINKVILIGFCIILLLVSVGLLVYLLTRKEKFKKSTLCNINNDYLSNDGWKYICNNNSVIFVETQKLSDKSTIDYLQNIDKPFVLVTANNLALSSLTKDHLSIIENPSLLHWFGTHAGETHTKFSPLPLGPKWNWKSTEFGGKDENFEDSCKKLNKACKLVKNPFGSNNRSTLVYWNMNLSTTNNPRYIKEHKNIRNTIFQSLKNNEVINGESTQKKDWKSYLSDLRDSVFCISPPGNGPDAHRTWEALHMGCIPIVSSFEPLNSLYEDLPIIIVDDWSKINIPFLKQKQQEIYEKNIFPSNLNKLSLKYWRSKIYSMLKFRSIIVEPRPHPALKAVLQNICEKLKTPITIVHGTKNKEFVHEIISDIPCVDLVLEINTEQLNGKTYSKLLTTEEFWDKTRKDESKVLIFQTDSGICGDDSDLSKYIKYDYCGAPWLWDKIKQNRGGNGGFSIRDPEIAKKHIRQYGTHTDNEDLKFSKWCIEDQDCDICDYNTAKEFSTETVPNNSWAFHNNFSFAKYTPICDFNKEIAKLNKNTLKYNYKIPDSNWRPTFTETYNKNNRERYKSKREPYVIDAFPFYNELKMLEFRLTELNDVVDYFIIVEATKTYTNNDKELYYDKNKEKFSKFKNKIIHVIVDDMPEGKDSWEREIFQRNQISRGVKKLDLQDNDILTITDADEIPNTNMIKEFKNSGKKGIYSLDMDFYYYNFNTKKLLAQERGGWDAAKILTFDHFNKSATDIRRKVVVTASIPKGGWHLSYFGDIDMIINKVKNFAHQEYNNQKYTDKKKIQDIINNNKDLYDREGKNWIKVDIKDIDYLPKYYKMLL